MTKGHALARFASEDLIATAVIDSTERASILGMVLRMLLLSLPLAMGLLACGGTEQDQDDTTKAALIRTGAVGDACTVDGKSGKCKVDDCTKCEVDGECWQKLNDGSWGICLKNPFSR